MRRAKDGYGYDYDHDHDYDHDYDHDHGYDHGYAPGWALRMMPERGRIRQTKECLPGAK